MANNPLSLSKQFSSEHCTEVAGSPDVFKSAHIYKGKASYDESLIDPNADISPRREKIVLSEVKGFHEEADARIPSKRSFGNRNSNQ